MPKLKPGCFFVFGAAVVVCNTHSAVGRHVAEAIEAGRVAVASTLRGIGSGEAIDGTGPRAGPRRAHCRFGVTALSLHEIIAGVAVPKGIRQAPHGFVGQSAESIQTTFLCR